MAKKLLIRTPVTSDGKNLVYDENKKVIYKESYAELSAEQLLKEQNALLPEHLRSEISKVELPEDAEGATVAALRKRIKELEDRKEVEALQNKVAELEAELAAKNQNKKK